MTKIVAAPKIFLRLCNKIFGCIAKVRLMNRPILRYHGQKFNIASWIINHMTAHNHYVDVMGGSGSILLAKPPVAMETYNDGDANVVNYFRVLRERPDELLRAMQLTPWAREELETCRIPSDDPLENARRFMFSTWASISGMAFDKSTGFRTSSYFGQSYSLPVRNFRDMLNSGLMHKIADRLKNVQIENRDAFYIIERYDHKDTLLYIDPPYVQETRVIKDRYQIEWGDETHIRLADLLNECASKVIVSGYDCQLYKTLFEEKGWSRKEAKTRTNSGGYRTESIWLSPNMNTGVQSYGHN